MFYMVNLQHPLLKIVGAVFFCPPPTLPQTCDARVPNNRSSAAGSILKRCVNLISFSLDRSGITSATPKERHRKR